MALNVGTRERLGRRRRKASGLDVSRHGTRRAPLGFVIAFVVFLSFGFKVIVVIGQFVLLVVVDLVLVGLSVLLAAIDFSPAVGRLHRGRSATTAAAIATTERRGNHCGHDGNRLEACWVARSRLTRRRRHVDMMNHLHLTDEQGIRPYGGT